MIVRFDLLVAFGLAAGLHVAGLGYYAATGGFDGAGADGRAALSLQVAPAGIAGMVADWEAIPEVSAVDATLETPTEDAAFTKVNIWTDESIAPKTSKLSDAPEVAKAPMVEAAAAPALGNFKVAFPSAPVMDVDDGVTRVLASAMPVAVPQVPDFEAPSAVERAVVATPRPVKRPVPSAPVPALVARGTGGGVSAGNLGATQAVATLAPAARQAAQAAWASKIQSRIARHQVFPRGVRGQGRVRLQMDILADGRLGAVRVDRSSGVAAFDKAALRAARLAAPFPSAPEGLHRSRYAFAQWVSFSR